MNHIQNGPRIAIITFLTPLAFGPPHTGQAAQNETEPFSCANVSEIPQTNVRLWWHFMRVQMGQIGGVLHVMYMKKTSSLLNFPYPNGILPTWIAKK